MATTNEGDWGGGWGSGEDGGDPFKDTPVRDINAERAGRFGGPDLKGLAEGKYDNGGGNKYGIDAERGHSWRDFFRGAKYGKAAGLGGALLGGAAGLAFGHEISPEINGGGWKGLGASGQGNGGGWQGGGGNGPGDHYLGLNTNSSGPGVMGGWNSYGSGTKSTGQGHIGEVHDTYMTGPYDRFNQTVTGGGMTPGAAASSVTGGNLVTGGATKTGSSPALTGAYADPITGRLLYQSLGPGGTSNLSYADQQMLDSIMGTNVASQNLTQQIGLLKNQIAGLQKSGKDTTWYRNELKRLEGLQGQAMSPDNPMLSYLNSGLQEQVANEQLDNSVANTMRANDLTMARRGMSASPMQDQVRASLGLSTAQARNQNKLTAQDAAYQKRINLMNFLKNSQNQDYAQQMGLTGIPMTIADWENQQRIADKTLANQNAWGMYNALSQNQAQQQNSGTDWSSILGNVAGSVDWGSFF